MREAIDGATLTSYALGELSEAERAAVAARLAESEELRNELREIEKTAALLRQAFTVAPEHALSGDQRSAIEAEALRFRSEAPRGPTRLAPGRPRGGRGPVPRARHLARRFPVESTAGAAGDRRPRRAPDAGSPSGPAPDARGQRERAGDEHAGAGHGDGATRTPHCAKGPAVGDRGEYGQLDVEHARRGRLTCRRRVGRSDAGLRSAADRAALLLHRPGYRHRSDGRRRPWSEGNADERRDRCRPRGRHQCRWRLLLPRHPGRSLHGRGRPRWLQDGAAQGRPGERRRRARRGREARGRRDDRDGDRHGGRKRHEAGRRRDRGHDQRRGGSRAAAQRQELHAAHADAARRRGAARNPARVAASLFRRVHDRGLRPHPRQPVRAGRAGSRSRPSRSTSTRPPTRTCAAS